MENKRIKQIMSLDRKWVIKTQDNLYIQPNDYDNHYNLCMQYEADAFRFTEGEAIDFLTKFPELIYKLKSTIVQVIR